MGNLVKREYLFYSWIFVLFNIFLAIIVGFWLKQWTKTGIIATSIGLFYLLFMLRKSWNKVDNGLLIGWIKIIIVMIIVCTFGLSELAPRN